MPVNFIRDWTFATASAQNKYGLGGARLNYPSVEARKRPAGGQECGRMAQQGNCTADKHRVQNLFGSHVRRLISPNPTSKELIIGNTHQVSALPICSLPWLHLTRCQSCSERGKRTSEKRLIQLSFLRAQLLVLIKKGFRERKRRKRGFLMGQGSKDMAIF